MTTTPKALLLIALVLAGAQGTASAGPIPDRVDCVVQSLQTYCDGFVNPYAPDVLLYGRTVEAYLTAQTLQAQNYVEYLRNEWGTGETAKVTENMGLIANYSGSIATYTREELVPFVQSYVPGAGGHVLAYVTYLQTYAGAVQDETVRWLNYYDEHDGQVVPEYDDVAAPGLDPLIQLPPLPPPPPPMQPPAPPAMPPQPHDLPLPPLPIDVGSEVTGPAIDLAWQAVSEAYSGVHFSQAAMAAAQAEPVDTTTCHLNQLDRDSDHDGLANALEIGLRDWVYGGRQSYDPCLPDTDGDGVWDGQDLDVLHQRDHLGVKISARLKQFQHMDSGAGNKRWGEPYIAVSALGNTGEAAQDAFYPMLDWPELRYGGWGWDNQEKTLNFPAQADAQGFLDLLPADIQKWGVPTSPSLSYQLQLRERDGSCDDVYGRAFSGNWGECPANFGADDVAGFGFKLIELVDKALENTQNPGTIPMEIGLTNAHNVGTLYLDFTIEANACSISIAQALAALQSGQFLRDGTAQCHP